MKVYATLPAPHRDKLLKTVVEHPLVNSLRFNTGTRVHTNPLDTLEIYLDAVRGKEFWLDIKGRQLRITQWAAPSFGDIVLNHEIDVNLPTEIFFRGDEKSFIRKINGNRIYIDPPPPRAIGAGQAVNIPDDSLLINGYFTDEDFEYIKAAKQLGIENFMLSFVEEEKEIQELLEIIPNAKIVAKIESRKGVRFIENLYSTLQYKPALMAARDDLYINIGEDKTNIFSVLEKLIEIDKQAILASRLFISLEEREEISLSDLSDFMLMKSIGYNSFLLSDGLCAGEKNFLNAMDIFKKFERKKS